MVILTDNGALSMLADAAAHWLHSLRTGLFTGDFRPWHGAVLAQLEPCSFSGYSGLRDMITWGSPTLDGPRAVITHGYFDWTHDGGPDAQKVQGYYVISQSEELVWAELRADGPLLMQSLGDVCRVIPRFSQRSEF
jgi:hypothetical protein